MTPEQWCDAWLTAYYDSKSTRFDAVHALVTATDGVPPCAHAVAAALSLATEPDQRTIIFRALLELMGRPMDDYR